MREEMGTIQCTGSGAEVLMLILKLWVRLLDNHMIIWLPV